MNEFLELMGPEVMPLIMNLLMLVVGAIFTILGRHINKLLKKYEDSEEMNQIRESLEHNKEVVKLSVEYAQQIGASLDGPEKYKLAKDKAIEIANSKGFHISEQELDAMIEQAVGSFKNGLASEVNVITSDIEEVQVTKEPEATEEAIK